MLIQLAIDAPDQLPLLPVLAPYVDIVEAGTPLLKSRGIDIVTQLRADAPGCDLLVDTKTVDGGAFEAEMAFGSGASMMTVLAQASDATVEAVRHVALAYDGLVIFDTVLDLPVDEARLRARAGDGNEPWLVLHAASDLADARQWAQQHRRSEVVRWRAAGWRVVVAGGIGRDVLPQVIAVEPDVVVVGSSVTGSNDPEGEIGWIREMVERG